MVRELAEAPTANSQNIDQREYTRNLITTLTLDQLLLNVDWMMSPRVALRVQIRAVRKREV